MDHTSLYNEYHKRKKSGNGTKVVSAFPGMGKSHFCARHKATALDSDSSGFSWTKDAEGNNTKERNPDFPMNYIEHIRLNMGKYEYIFVSTHKEVRDALCQAGIFFYLAYPDPSRKEEFLERYRARGNDEKFVETVSRNWDAWMQELQASLGCQHIRMASGNLEDAF